MYFRNHPRAQVKSLLHRDNIQELIDPHIDWDCSGSFESEFSSWTNCFGVALNFIKDVKTGHISFIDRKLLKKRDVEFFNVAELAGKGYVTNTYKHEWIAHGPVSGPGLFCVSVEELKAAGIICDDGCTCGYTTGDLEHEVVLGTVTKNVAIEKAVTKGVQLARIQLQLDKNAVIPPEMSAAFYTLVLMLIAIQSNPNIAVEGFQGADAVIHEIMKQVGLDVPNELEAAFRDQYTTNLKSHCERTRCIVKGIFESRRTIKNTLFDPAVHVEGSKVVQNFKARVDQHRALPLVRQKRLALPTGSESKPVP